MSDENKKEEHKTPETNPNPPVSEGTEKQVDTPKNVDEAKADSDENKAEVAVNQESETAKAAPVQVSEEKIDTPKSIDEAEADSDDNKTEVAVTQENETAKTAPAQVSEENKTEIIADAIATKTDDDEEATDDDEEEVASSDEEETEEEEEVKDYHALTKKQLIAELASLLKSKPIQEIKNDVEEIKSEFNAKFAEEVAAKKEEFLAQGGNIIDFHHSTPLKKEFSSLYFDYKEKRNTHYRNLKKDLQSNLEKRLELIEELKGLLNAEESINATYNHFKDIQSRWFEAGAIPRDKYNTVWNTYHHHVENFYDFLHLNREFRDLDFKHNLEQKLKLISRAEELATEENSNRAFRELQMLHKMWKEEIGPVAKEFRDEVWDKFSAATKVVHDKRQAFLEEEEKHYETNYETKMSLIAQINEIVSQTKSAHQSWQNAIKKVQEVRDLYFATGKVPRNKNKETWNAFKEATRNFNHNKNAFYKNQKKEQFTNLEKKRELIATAEANKDSDDFEATTPLMKKIQGDWKKIGHVPRKDSDKIWKQFKAACNHYFDRLHAEKNEANKEEVANFEAKSEFLEAFKTMELSGDHVEDLKTIKGKISEWKQLGRVPYNKKNIDQKFNKELDAVFGKLDLGKKEKELIMFENKISTMVSQEDDRKLQNERFFISKKIDETKAEINQLENNLGFFQHVPDDNPMVKEVHNNINRHKEQLEVWKAKLQKIKSLA